MSTVFQLPLSPFGLGIPEVQVAPDDSILVAQDVVRSFSRDFRQLRWTFAVPNGLLAGIEPPRLTLGDGQLFVASVGTLYAVDLATGRLQWQRVVEPNPNGELLSAVAFLPASQAAGFPDMVFATSGETLFGLRAGDGSVVWTARIFDGSILPNVILSTAPGPVQATSPANTFLGPLLPGGIVFVTLEVPIDILGFSLQGFDPATGNLVYLPNFTINRIVSRPLFAGGWLYLAGFQGSERRIFAASLMSLPNDDASLVPPRRLGISYPDPRPGVFDPPFAVLLGLNTDPNEPTFCWTSESGDLFVQNGEGPASSPVPVSRQPPSVPIAYFNDNDEGRVLLVGDTPAGSSFASGTLVALPIGSDPQLAFTSLSRFGVAGPIRVNFRQFAAVAVSPGLTVRGGVVFSFDLNSL
jgi:hypothetical protein